MIRNRRMKTTIGRDDDEKSNEIPDDRRTRKYLKITSIDSNEWDIDSVAAIFDHFKFERHSDRKWIVVDQCVLKQNLIQKNGKIFGFISYETGLNRQTLFIPFCLKSQAVSSRKFEAELFRENTSNGAQPLKCMYRESHWFLLNGCFTLKL